MKTSSFVFRSGLVVGIFLGCVSLATPERGVPASHGILNFGQVNSNVFRGAWPDAAGVRSLQALGIRSILDLRMPSADITREAALTRASGMVYTNLPLRGFSRPTDAQISACLTNLASLPGPVFVHCEHGCDRAGTIIACYRIQHDQWTGTDALHEAEIYGISRFERGMRQGIADFARAHAPP